MHRFPTFSAQLCLLIAACFPSQSNATSQTNDQQVVADQPIGSEWNSSHAQHVLGLPGARARETGTLTITANALSFTGKTSQSIVRLQSIFAVGSGNERVELWGMKGTLLRMAMPNGAGLFAATFMHHRVDMFTVEFTDQSGGYHAAVFFLPANEAARAVQIIAAAPKSHRKPASNACSSGPVQLASVRVPVPAWSDTKIPAAYRALLYEHLVDGLRATGGVDRVYRDGEIDDRGCPQFTVQLSVTGFKAGNQVVRASTGPVGFFVGTTQMTFDARITNARGQEVVRDQIKATVRGESESTKVAESVARKVVKEFAALEKQRVRDSEAATRSATASR
jgi:hypothetical protein